MASTPRDKVFPQPGRVARHNTKCAKKYRIGHSTQYTHQHKHATCKALEAARHDEQVLPIHGCDGRLHVLSDALNFLDDMELLQVQ